MKAWRAEQFGKPSDVLKLVEVDVPTPKAGEALLRVLATNVGLPDKMMLEGDYFLTPSPPITPGQEVVGIVESAGAGYPFPIGARVIAGANFMSGSGGLAEYCLSPSEGTVPAPEEMSDEQAAAFLGTFHVAYVGLVNRAAARPGQTLLVLGGAGGVGSTAVQLGKALGLYVIATVRDDSQAEFCRQQGASHVINTSTGSLGEAVHALTAGKGADIVYDTVGQAMVEQALEAIAIGGRYILIGFAGGKGFANIAPFTIQKLGISVTGALHSVRTIAERNEGVRTLSRLFSEGKISVPIDEVIAFGDVARALDRLGGGVSGKLIARVGRR